MVKLELESCESLVEDVQLHLRLPQRIIEAEQERENVDLGQKLGGFLVKKGYIKDIYIVDVNNKEDEFLSDYNIQEKIILVNKKAMSVNYWRDYVYRKQTILDDEKSFSLFPMHPMYISEEKETKKYLFLNKTIHAYREYLKDKESLELGIKPENYYKTITKQDISTPLANLIKICHEKRKVSAQRDLTRSIFTRGLSLPGSHQKLSCEDKNKEYVNRALIDVDELITMYIWSPKFFESYIDYLSSKPKDILYKKQLYLIKDAQEAQDIKNLVHSYIEQMKEEI